ncbi:MAG: Spy/CpxP family protein refolding chaperone [Deltaproteobacteria bacterium]|nr:Spy/CpxP family protein refolding chaperone [Deltaproteobacteria bacterium]
MKEKTYQVARVVVMAAFLSTIFLADANLSFAASGKNKSSVAVITTAVDDTEARIKELRDALKITGAQEELWNNLTQVMRENAREMDALAKDRAENIKTMNAVEHMKLHSQITETHLDQLKKFIPPFEALYASMSDKQKKITDTMFKAERHGKHRRK